MTNWSKIAAGKFPNAKRILGNGRWSVSTPDSTVVYLAADERQQKCIALGVEGAVKSDLQPVNFDSIPDLEDHEERRARRRARNE